jgi:hypothetical protein
MDWLELASLLRLVPYALVGLIAWRKGFKWLAATSFYLVCIATFTTLAHASPELRAVFGSFTALLLLQHALDLKTRK